MIFSEKMNSVNDKKTKGVFLQNEYNLKKCKQISPQVGTSDYIDAYMTAIGKEQGILIGNSNSKQPLLEVSHDTPLFTLKRYEELGM